MGVSVFTLVAISLERYFAICEPLRSRSWQTLSHSYRIIGLVWLISMIIMIPVAVYQRLKPLRSGSHKCSEDWSNQNWLKAYTLFLDTMLLVLPLLMMLVAYGRISWTLWKGIRIETKNAQGENRIGVSFSSGQLSVWCVFTSQGPVSLPLQRLSRGSRDGPDMVRMSNGVEL